MEGKEQWKGRNNGRKKKECQEGSCRKEEKEGKRREGGEKARLNQPVMISFFQYCGCEWERCSKIIS